MAKSRRRVSASSRLERNQATGEDDGGGRKGGAAQRLKSRRRGEENAKAADAKDGKKQAGRISRRDAKEPSRRSSRRSGRRERSASPSLDERKARIAAEAAKRKKRNILLAVAGGVALIVLLIMWGSIQRHLLLQDLKSKNAGARKAAVRDLVAWKEQARPALVAALLNKSGDWPDASRADAAVALASMKLTSANRDLRQLAVKGEQAPTDDDKKVRCWVLRALVQTGVFAGGRFPREIFLANADADAATRLWVAKGLAGFSGKKVLDAMQVMLDDDDQSVRAAAVTSFEHIAKPADTVRLLPFLTAEEERKRDTARAIFAHFDNPDTVAVLGKALKGADEKTTIMILGMFEGFQSVGTMPALVSKAIASPSMKVRIAALRTAGRRQLKGTEEKVIAAAKDDIPEVRIAVTEAIKDFGRASLAARIHQLLADPQAEVRRAAIKTVVALKDRSAAEDLVKLLDHDDKSTQQAAITGLQMLFPLSKKKWGGRKAHTWKKWWKRYQGQRAYVETLHKVESKILDLLENQDDESYKRVTALINEHEKWIRAYLEDKDKEAVPEILQAHGAYLRRLVSSRKFGMWRYAALKDRTAR